ncbi:MAG: peptidylprolyl isomerase [Saprospiraceae bacterium]|nr:peptidylprolyl isomerase [Saprospiraceae bacterium]
MGLITSIRKRLWMVTILMALALVGFLVMDMSSGRSSWFFNNPDTLGSAAGEKISWKDFQKTEAVLYRNADVDFYGRKEYIWHQTLERIILEKDAVYNGTGVSEAELQELEFGQNLSPIIERNFRDPNTGQVLREQLNQFQNGLENGDLPAEAREFWKVQQKEIIKDRMFKKMENLTKSALYMPTFMCERHFAESNAKMAFNFSRIPYDVVKDEEIEITDADIDAYVKSKASYFKTEEETRDINYAVIRIVPTSEDSASISKILQDKLDAFRNASKDSLFIVSNLGTWDESYSLIKDLPMSALDTILKSPVGTVVGPYVDGGDYKISKILGKKIIPDSVKSRHILRRVTTNEEYTVALRLIDSLKNVLEKGQGSFDSLAIKFSQDQGSGIKGGDLGFAAIGAMVKPYNDVLFYTGEKGKFNVVASQFGLHLIEITDMKFLSNNQGIRLGTIAESIQPGDQIMDKMLDEAQSMVEQHSNLDALKKAIADGKTYVLELMPGVLANDYKNAKLGEEANSTWRQIVRWAFEKNTKVGNVSPEVYSLQDPVKRFTDRLVIAGLENINPKGLPKASSMREKVKNDILIRKKFEIIKQKAGTVTALTGKYGEYLDVKIDSASEVTVNGQQMPIYGYEPDILTLISKVKPGELGGPFRGETGVYFVQMINITDPGKSSNIENFRRFYRHTAVYTSMNYMTQALKKNYKVSDSRSKFF